MRKLDAIAQGLPGEKGKRIKRLMQVVLSTGSKDWRDLWYYNDMVIEMYVDWKVDNSERIKSTELTKGKFPFDGQAVWHVQGQSEASGAERSKGMWRIHPFRKMFDDFCGDQEDFDAIKKRLWAIDEEMYKGWHEMELDSARSGLGGEGPIKVKSRISLGTYPPCPEINRISIGRSDNEGGAASTPASAGAELRRSSRISGAIA